MSLVISHLGLNLKELSVLEDVNAIVPQGSFFCVIGPNGAGKTIFTKTLLGIYRPSRGSVKISERLPQEMPATWVGYVPQLKTFDRRFPALTWEWVACGIDGKWPWRLTAENKEKVMHALQKVHAEKLFDRSLSTLSGGELQRVYLARAFICARKILILDEPTTGIDSFGESDLYSLLEDHRRTTGTTVMMVTHDLDVARHHATHVLVLNRKQLAFGSPEDSLQQDVIERAFGHSQHHHHSHGHAHTGGVAR